MKKILSMVLALFMLISMCISTCAADNWLMSNVDFESESYKNSWVTNGTFSVINDSTHDGNALQCDSGYYYTKNTMNTSSMKGIEFKFDIKWNGTLTLYSTSAYHDNPSLNNNFQTLYKFINSSNNVQVKYDNTVIAENNDKLKLGNWYSCTLKINQESYPVPVSFTMCDTNGDVVVTDSRNVYSAHLKGREKADFVFYASGATGNFYLDNTSVREITAYDLISYVPVIEEDFDNVTSTSIVTLPERTSDVYKKVADFGYGEKLYFLNGSGIDVSVINKTDSDKILNLDLSKTADDHVGIMYLAQNMSTGLYVNEMTFTYTDCVTGARIRNTGFGDKNVIASLRFADDIICVGMESNAYDKVSYDFVSGNEYTVRTSYVLENNQTRVKVEVTDGTTSAMAGGLIKVTPDAINGGSGSQRHYPEYVFYIDNSLKTANDKIEVLNNNIYSGPAIAADTRLSYIALNLDKQAVEAGDITAGVTVDFTPYFAGTDYVSDAKLIIATYAGGKLNGLKTESLKLNSNTYNTTLNVSQDATKVKAMLWDMGTGSATPLAASVTIGK